MFAYYAREALMVALMVFGFGFVVFFHELGHFLAAKWVGIKVEQFAVGFGQALFAWRKGIGWKVGSTHPRYRELAMESLAKGQPEADPAEYTDEQISAAADKLGLGETEYRLNWVPLGGYVKMLGQDDLKPGAEASDPRAYNRKGIGQRMIVVSAGVIMNIILAGIGFMVIFLIGFKAPAPIAGKVQVDSPADRAGIHVGDRILEIDGTRQYDFTRIVLSTALLSDEHDVPVKVERTKDDGTKEIKVLSLRPARAVATDSKSFLAIGVGPTAELRGPDPLPAWQDKGAAAAPKKGTEMPDSELVQPGDVFTSIAGHPLKATGNDFDSVRYGYTLLARALDTSAGKPVAVTIRGKDGKERCAAISPRIDAPFGDRQVSIAGMEPRPRIDAVPEGSSVDGKLFAGDVITAIAKPDNDAFPNYNQVRDMAVKAGEAKEGMTITVLRDGKTVKVPDLLPKTKVERGRGLGVGLGFDEAPVVSQVVKDSPADKAGVKPGSRIATVDGVDVTSWFAIRDALLKPGDHALTVQAPGDDAAKPATIKIAVADAEMQAHTFHTTTPLLDLRELEEVRKTTNPLTAMGWGVVETRDLILQFYVTLARMFQGKVSPANMMGPLGIVTAGAKFAIRGTDWLVWFLAMISANLAVVNFLPIPIVDGGLFTFLILEKIQGKPLSPKAQAIAQIVGFALIISVFLLVTYQDIRRTIGL